MLWSAVSRVSGSHFSASVAVRRIASPYVAMRTDSISAVPICRRNSNTRPMGPCVWITDGYALKLVAVIRNGLVLPPKCSHFGGSIPRCCHSPSRPSKGLPGPVIPSAANSAENTAVRTAAAVPHRQLADPRHTKWNTGGDRDGDSVRHGLPVQSENHASPTGRADGRKHPLIPTLQRNLVRKATEHLVGRCDRRDHCSAICLVAAGHSQHAGNHVTRMARSSGSVGVVTVEIPNKNSICEGR